MNLRSIPIIFMAAFLFSCSDDERKEFPYNTDELGGTWEFSQLIDTPDGTLRSNICHYKLAHITPLDNYVHKQFTLNFETGAMTFTKPICISSQETNLPAVELSAHSLKLMRINGQPYFTATQNVSCSNTWVQYYRIVSLTETTLVIGWFRNQAEVNKYFRMCDYDPIDYDAQEYQWNHEVTYTRVTD